MFSRTASGILLFLLLASTLTLAFHVQPVKAIVTVYIRADGSIDPSDAPIQTVDNITYTLTGDITSDESGIVVEKNNITIDGAGYTARSALEGSVGIDLTNRSGVTIRNINVRNYWYGILLNASSGNSICGNNITETGLYGIYMRSSPSNIIYENNLTANDFDSIRLEYSPNNTISGNTMVNNHWGIVFSSSNSSIVSRNNITGSTGGPGIYLTKSHNNCMEENNMANNIMGGIVVYGSNNGIRGNIITSATQGAGIHIGYIGPAPGTTINNSVVGNRLTDNEDGIWLVANYSIIFGNTIADCSWSGIFVDIYSNYNNITRNEIVNNKYGIWLYSSSDNNTIFHNNFVDNADQAYSSEPVNVWDDGYPSGGNYWSDLNPQDVYHGLYQNETGSDKIGDTPYVIDANNTDRYPLIFPFGYLPTPDLNHDGIINIIDLVKSGLAFGSIPGMPNWSAYCDINQDGRIGILDLALIAVNFGKQWPPP